LNESESGVQVVSIFGPFVVRPLDSPKTVVLLVYEFKLQVAIGLEAHLQKKNWGIMQRISESPTLRMADVCKRCQ
jgi:hypothetical protein